MGNCESAKLIELLCGTVFFKMARETDETQGSEIEKVCGSMYACNRWRGQRKIKNAFEARHFKASKTKEVTS